MKSRKKKGDEGEKFVFDIFVSLNFLTELHPRTFRLIFVNGKRIQVSQDNDYHNHFDIKAERYDFMVYAQVKFETAKTNTSTAQKLIDRDYPYEFPYQRIQTWQVWKEWVKPEKGKRHKEFRYIIQERRGFTNTVWRNTEVRKGKWITIDISSLTKPLHIDMIE